VNAALPTEAQARKNIPLARGLLDYFPAALAAVAEVSRIGNEQHNPGQEMHHARGKSSDHADCAMRHLVDRGTIDTDGQRHTAKAAWRILALLQEELEADGAPIARAARLPESEGVDWRLDLPSDVTYDDLRDAINEAGKNFGTSHIRFGAGGYVRHVCGLDCAWGCIAE
jgi:hypothetical protein